MMKKLVLLILLGSTILLGACKKDGNLADPAIISDLSMNPAIPGPDSPVTISATVTDANGIASVKLFYAVGTGNYILVNMSASGDTYSGVIPAQTAGSVIKYYVEVVNSSSIISYAPTSAPTTTATYTVTSAPVITNLHILPASPTELESVSVIASITDLHSITSAKLYYKVGSGSYTSLTMNASGNNYSAIIPAQASSSVVSYYIEATNSDAIVSYAPETAPATVATYTVNCIFMNEVWSWGLDPDLDWIELYNNSNASVNIGGYKLYDSGAANDQTKNKLTIPDGTIIPAHGFYTVVVDDASVSGDFGLSKNGEEIWLENANGVVIDNFVFAATTLATQSYGRQPDGSNNFYIFTEITKNTSNNAAVTVK